MELRVKKPALLLAMGVLVLALAGVGCGDDDSDPAGTGGGGSGGSGGTGGGGTGGTGGGAAPTVAECTDAVETNTGATLTSDSACAACLCDMEAEREPTIACGAPCWALVLCVQNSRCATVPENMATACAFEECATEIAVPGALNATDFSPVIRSCIADCSAGPDVDGGDTDGGN